VIVTCESCSTSFQLDESRIPPTGARVRCSRCKHAFFLASPAASQAEAVHSIAAEAVEEAAVAPSIARDLEDSWDGLNASSSPGDAAVPSSPPSAAPDSARTSPPAAAPDAALDPGTELDEEDWHFSEEVRTEGDELEQQGSGPFASALGEEIDAELASDFGDVFGEDGRSGFAAAPADEFDTLSDPAGGFDAAALSRDVGAANDAANAPDPSAVEIASASEPGAGIGLDPASPRPDASSGHPASHAAPDRDESSFGSVDDFSSWMEEDEPVSDLAAELASEISAELEASDADGGTYSAGGQADDLGDPESWDLVGSDDLPRVRPTSSSGRGRALASELDAVEAGDLFGSAVDENGPVPDLALATQSFAAGPWGRLSRFVGWVATAAAVLAVGQLVLEAETKRWAQGPVSVSAGALIATSAEGGWLETSRSGDVLRITGVVENGGRTALAPGPLSLVLLDASGEAVAAPPVPAGQPLAPRILREAEPGILAREAAAAVRRFLHAPIAAGERRPFEVVIPAEQLPGSAARFVLEMDEPRPARTSEPAEGGQLRASSLP
jgi:predicted Zn finger-like uncharacterized protein